ncbi:MAG: hypothetical protein HY513_04085 [Candidatus Aenigmarchaeota archaeon]|nr:hypothetical protein [Candidatus Aenigmarchaeota archaeon]
MSCYSDSPRYSGASTVGYAEFRSQSYAPVSSYKARVSYERPESPLDQYVHALSAQNLPALKIDDHGLPTYPSYLGVPITEPLLGEHLLGQTNGRRINISSSTDPQIKNFVLMHEEEHIKDMSASEWEVDKRAVQRLIKSKKSVSWIKVKLLLKARWHEKADLLLSDEMAEQLATT